MFLISGLVTLSLLVAVNQISCSPAPSTISNGQRELVEQLGNQKPDILSLETQEELSGLGGGFREKRFRNVAEAFKMKWFMFRHLLDGVRKRKGGMRSSNPFSFYLGGMRSSNPFSFYLGGMRPSNPFSFYLGGMRSSNPFSFASKANLAYRII
ncbi:uncharacterized protein LOC111711640 [Eurytemora carolleeae]|uniref:uncharacterized protein LOC111711640 n=1 Tax=Eurytemora carolleeae TaxID=1294199 RepID=UPI000C77E636|nr:uncharacterized protein LOC111711640 [Eurytemora carolleeae]|eukprot:XP_023341800.1 uncharacterized protein LOC111711640 [Eurytemora affinis]